MSVLRSVLSAYRKLQYKVCGRQEDANMPLGELCHHDPFEDEVNHGDVVHPCVRFIPEGFLGHKWWMVYTPYYAANDTTENPILCYAESDSADPPLYWKVYCLVQGQPEKGYNSDPTLFYDEGELYVMWRENLTKRCEDTGFVRATFGAKVIEGGIGDVFGPLVGTPDFEIDAEVSPTFLKQNGKYRCLAMHLKFHSESISRMNEMSKKIISSIAQILDILGIWSQQKSFGIAQWTSDKIEGPYTLERTIKLANCNKLYRPWHMDFFENNNKTYAIVQTNQCNADICLAESEDGIHFTFQDEPLMTNKRCGEYGIYKPTGGVIDNMFYLYYTSQSEGNRDLNKLYVSRKQISDIIKK